jgi:GT2 family glycosyltransferase
MESTMTAVIVPVHNALAETRRCLAALYDHIEARTTVVVIDDASEEAGIDVNLGMALAGGEDIILLNSDTSVSPGWLTAIEACAASDPGIASITPLTNNGEIASIPNFCQPNPWPADVVRWARACRESGPAQYPEVPTGVGFCMYLRRACLDQIGLFDEQAFGRGYGEENDWCMRAIQAGWRHVLCDHAFVAHQGNASFGPLGLGPGGEAMETLLARHPDYLERVRAFIEADPMAERREAIVARYAELRSLVR